MLLQTELLWKFIGTGVGKDYSLLVNKYCAKIIKMNTLLSCSWWHLHLCSETVITVVRARRTLKDSVWNPLCEWGCAVKWPDSHVPKYTSCLLQFINLPLPWRRKFAIKNTSVWLNWQKDCLWFKGFVHELRSGESVSVIMRSDVGIFKSPNSSSAQSCFLCCFVAESFWQCVEQRLNTAVWQRAKLLSNTSLFSSLSNAKAG